MTAINKVQLTGNLGASPEIKIFDNGNKLARFTMATTEEYRTRTGDKSSDTQWHYVVAWGKVADKIEAELQKGSFVTVEGRIINRSYTDSNGQKKYSTQIVASDVVLYKRAA